MAMVEMADNDFARMLGFLFFPRRLWLLDFGFSRSISLVAVLARVPFLQVIP